MAQLDHQGPTRERRLLPRPRLHRPAPTTGPAYYVGLDDGRVLILHGDYLAEYDGRKPLTARAFPCTDFSTLRDKTTGQILGLSCTGTPLDPEFTAPEKSTRTLPADGTLITDRTYSAIKSDYARPRERPRDVRIFPFQAQPQISLSARTGAPYKSAPHPIPPPVEDLDLRTLAAGNRLGLLLLGFFDFLALAVVAFAHNAKT